jgi:MFS transporter, AAHS family, 4-hydroxybenzoate transporter
MTAEEIASTGWKQQVLVLVIIIAVLVDGLDVKLLSFAVPIILVEWHIDKAAIGPALAAALLGMACGAGGGGWLGDRLGRRTIILASLVSFGAATIAVAFAHDLFSLTIYRLISGLGFGALTPNAYVLVSEWLPPRSRPRAVAWVAAGSPLGGMAGALLALGLLPSYGWNGCFLIVGIGTIAFAAALYFWLPESARFLIKRGQHQAAAKQWRRIMGNQPSQEVLSRAEDAAKPGPSKTRIKLFSRDLSRLNTGATLCFFSSYFVNYVFSSWLPVIMTTSGYEISAAIQAGFVYNAMAIVGTMVTGGLVNTRGTQWVLIVASLVLLVVLGLLPWLLTWHAVGLLSGAWIPMAAFGLAGVATGTTASTISALVAAAYPTERRSSGVGLGVMAGRLGGVVASFYGGALLSVRGDDPVPLFIVLCLFTILVILSTLIIDKHTGGLLPL